MRLAEEESDADGRENTVKCLTTRGELVGKSAPLCTAMNRETQRPTQSYTDKGDVSVSSVIDNVLSYRQSKSHKSG